MFGSTKIPGSCPVCGLTSTADVPCENHKEGVNMRSFRSEDWFEIKGMGKVCTFKCEEDIPRNEVYKQKIEIDGTVYVCNGIQRFDHYLSDEVLRKGESVGLLVQKVGDDVKQAVDTLRKALKDDPEYYSSWQANIAIAFVDEFSSSRYGFGGLSEDEQSVVVHRMANQAADNFLKLLIG